jgi:FkbM family methyltransferase
MSFCLNKIREVIRSALRPPAAFVRRILTPSIPPRRFTWHKVLDGPIAGNELLLPEGTEIAELISSGAYEKTVVPVVQALVGSGDVCFDIGAHYGYYTMLLAKCAGSGQVHTFEPVASHADRIRQNVNRQAYRHVTVHEAAVAGTDGEMVLRLAEAPGADDSMAYLEQYGGVVTPASLEQYARFSSVTVKAVSLDSIQDRTALPQFIKIDAEGAEVSIIQGALSVISKAKPRMLVELHGVYEALACMDILRRLNYVAVVFNERRVNMPVFLIHQEDSVALDTIARVSGRLSTVLFGEAPGHGD